MPARPGGFRPRSSVDVVPARRLELVPVPSSRGDIDDLFQELAYLDSLEATANAVCAAAVRMAQADCAKKLVTEVDGRDVTFADRRKAIKHAMTAYAELHGDELFGDAKTAAFNFGSLKLRARPLGIKLREGLTLDDLETRLEARTTLRGKIARWLKGKLLEHPLSSFYRIKSEVNWSGIKDLVLRRVLSTKDAFTLGVELSGGEDELSIDVGKWEVSSQQRLPAETVAA